MNGPNPIDLHGRRILIVEDDYLIADDMARSLRMLGATVVGPTGNVASALQMIAEHDDLDAAVLDINLRGEKNFAAADALRARGIPFVFATGYDHGSVPERFGTVPRCEKPVTPETVVQSLFG